MKGTRWLWQTNPENLTEQQRQELAVRKERFPRLAELVQQREGLRAIFADRGIQDAATGAARLRAWLEGAGQMGLKGLDTFCGTLQRWLDKIANSFVSRSSNGRTEGFNRGLRSILCAPSGCSTVRTSACASSTASEEQPTPNQQLWRRTAISWVRQDPKRIHLTR